jgi:hypothetical protein
MRSEAFGMAGDLGETRIDQEGPGMEARLAFLGHALKQRPVLSSDPRNPASQNCRGK